MAEIKLTGVKKTYNKLQVIHGVDVAIADGEFIVIVGPSGCGKSTLLRMIAGLEQISSGEIAIGGKRVNEVEPKDRNIAMVFQNYALYPHMTVYENMSYGLRIRRMPVAEIRMRVERAAKILELMPFLGRRPRELSGGQRQRVAMGRAIVREPAVFLFDEPLSNLDAKLRVQMRADIAELQGRLGVTTVYVTHDQAEAMTLGHRVAVLKDARLQQCDTPRVLFDRPVNTFVAGFVGSPAMNLCRVECEADGSLSFGGVEIARPRGLNGATGGRSVIVGVRPEALELASEGVDASVEAVEELGSDAYIFCNAELADGPARLVARVEARRAPARGERVALRPSPEHEPHLFDAVSGERLGA